MSWPNGQVSTLGSGLSGLGFVKDLVIDCIVFLNKTFHSHSASLLPRVKMLLEQPADIMLGGEGRGE